jgi:hypothetical protein
MVTTQGVILTEAQKNSLLNQEIAPNWYYNPGQDISGSWFVGEVEVNVTYKPEFLFLKSLPIVTITLPEDPEP